MRADLDRRLIAAAYDNDVAAARRLIADGADVNAKDSTQQSPDGDGRTALEHARERGFRAIARALD